MQEGCSLRTFSSPNTPREGSGVGEAGGRQEGMGAKASPVSVSTGGFGASGCALGPEAVPGARNVDPESRKAWGAWP